MSVDTELVAMMNAVFADHRAAHGPTAGPELWDQLRALGLARLTGAEDSGGSGAGWREAAELTAATVRAGVRIGLPEHDLLACWLLEVAGVPVDDRTRTVAVLDESGTATAVPWASTAERIVLVWRSETGEHRVADVDAGGVRITAGANMIGEPRDTVSADVAALDGAGVSAETVATLQLKAALVRAIQVCTALDVSLELAAEHATARTQFGRPLAKFQAIQHMISDIAAEATLARTATEAALSAAVTSDWSAPSLAFRVAAARSCTGHAASVVVRNAHQVFGAIGTTAEHRLHEYTRAALAWRGEYGSVRSWDERVTSAALEAGAEGLWELITA
jgi:acyl-CoA dehydrogenase